MEMGLPNRITVSHVRQDSIKEFKSPLRTDFQPSVHEDPVLWPIVIDINFRLTNVCDKRPMRKSGLTREF